MSLSTQLKRLILGAALALAALAPAALAGPAHAAAPLTITQMEVRAAGTYAVVAFTSSEPALVSAEYKPATPAAGATLAGPAIDLVAGGIVGPIVPAQAHELKLTGLSSNTTYALTVTARTADNRTATAQTTFTTAKKRVRITLESIEVTNDGDLIGPGEPVWFVKPMGDGVSYTNQYGDAGLCYPNAGSAGKCKHGTFGEGRFTPLNESGRALQIIFAEEYFDRFPETVGLTAWAKEDDAIGGASIIECLTNPGCPVGDDAATREWRVPQGVEFAEQTVTVPADDASTGFASVLTFHFELVHAQAPYPSPVRNYPLNTWFVGR